MRRCSVVVAGLLFLAFVLAVPSQASVKQSAGRVFTVATAPLAEDLSLAMARDGTIYVLGDGRLYALTPTTTRLRRVARQHFYADVAPEAGGGVLLSDSEMPRVWRLSPRNELTRVAGANGDSERGFAGDNGPATAAQLCMPSALAALPGGGFVFADGPYVVRRVSAQGVITRAAATAVPSPCEDLVSTEPAPESVGDLAAMPDGTFAMSLAPPNGEGMWRIVRVDSSGGWSTLASMNAPYGLDQTGSSIAVAPDGSLLAVDGLGQLVRWPVGGGRRVKVLRDRSTPSIFDRDGARPRQFAADWVDGVAVAPDGGIIASVGSHLLYISPRIPRRMAVALRPYDGRASVAGYVASFLATRRGRATLSVRDWRGRTVAAATRRVTAGKQSLAVHRWLRAGVYALSLGVTGADGQRATDTLRLVLGGRLPLRLARESSRPDSECGSNCELEVIDGPCQRLGTERIDCRYLVDNDRECRSALLSRYGTVRVRPYACPPPNRPPFPERPHYDDHWRDVAPQQHP